MYSVKPPQQQGGPGTPLLPPCICGGVKLRGNRCIGRISPQKTACRLKALPRQVIMAPCDQMRTIPPPFSVPLLCTHSTHTPMLLPVAVGPLVVARGFVSAGTQRDTQGLSAAGHGHHHNQAGLQPNQNINCKIQMWFRSGKATSDRNVCNCTVRAICLSGPWLDLSL